MGNTLQDPVSAPGMIANEALFHLRNNTVMANRVHREYKSEFVKVGATVNIRRPVRFTVSTGATRVNQDVVEELTSITIDQRKHVSWNFSSQELTLQIEEFGRRYINPAMIVLADDVDNALTGRYVDSFWRAGTAGNTPDTFAEFAAIAQVLDEASVPNDARVCVVNPAANWGLASGLQNLNWTQKVADVISKGFLGNVAGFDIFMDQNIRTHSVNAVAPGAGTVVDEPGGVTEGDATIDIDAGAAASVYEAGDIITIAGVNSVNPINKTDTGNLQPFVVTAQNTADGVGQFLAVPVNPPFRAASGGRQTITALPADGAAVTLSPAADHAANLAFHRNALALVTVNLEMPDGVPWKAMMNHDGFNLRVLKSYDVDADQDVIRIDIFYGVRTIYPELLGRLVG